jgi:glyoxylase-like metal-dependent hydrolase (beta-lactamase superfamily II)
MTSVKSGQLRTVAPDVAYYTNQIVNLVMIDGPDDTWTLIDAGMPKSANEITSVVEERYGKNKRPSSIVLTHGHFDHVGSIVDLVLHWNVPVYAHELEFPYLTGQQAYPEPDTSVEGGLLAKISSYYPVQPVNISQVLRPLPVNGSVPGLPGWQWIHTPGHSPGHVAFFRETDRLLISGDAFVTVKQDSLYRVLLQKKQVCGPPVYLTTDWDAAFTSVKQLAALDPNIVIAGHGTAMEGKELQSGLIDLVMNWNEEAVPSHGKWVKEKRNSL